MPFPSILEQPLWQSCSQSYFRLATKQALVLIPGDNSILPALAFSLDMFSNTGSTYGVNEVLLASVLGALVFSVLACQPLVIVGVTGLLAFPSSLRVSSFLTFVGPITVFN